MQKGIFLNVVLKYAIPPNIIPLCFGFLIFYKYTIDTWLEFAAFGIVFVALSFIIDFFKMYRSNETTLKNKFLKVMLS